MTDEVKIEEAEGTLKGGYIPWAKEKYPFSKLTQAEWVDDSKMAVKGPSFVISKEDNPPSVLAAGRKRFKHCKFISRKIDDEGNVRVWLHPDSPLPSEKGVPGKVVEPKKTAPKKTAPKTPPKADASGKQAGATAAAS
ncbi:hypothetical protein vBCbaSRXM_90 [Citromicrobium phage vB_CbaS-RXM]|nr:hypothetical protein vBCbaSRXM_90 [Citromicrobium phage vB_CbaS-RXM]